MIIDPARMLGGAKRPQPAGSWVPAPFDETAPPSSLPSRPLTAQTTAPGWSWPEEEAPGAAQPLPNGAATWCGGVLPTPPTPRALQSPRTAALTKQRGLPRYAHDLGGDEPPSGAADPDAHLLGGLLSSRPLTAKLDVVRPRPDSIATPRTSTPRAATARGQRGRHSVR